MLLGKEGNRELKLMFPDTTPKLTTERFLVRSIDTGYLRHV